MKTVACLLILSGVLQAEIVDRVAIVVGDQIVKRSDILQEIRLAAFLNRGPLDFSLSAQKAAANRLIDQRVLRSQIDSIQLEDSDPEEVDALVSAVRKEYPSSEAFREALKKYGITEERLRHHLAWQDMVLRFVALRFSNPLDGEQAGKAPPDATNQQFFSWLDQTRKRTRIVYKEEDLR